MGRCEGTCAPDRQDLERIIRVISYPVSTEIDPRGFGLRACSDDLLELVYEIASAGVSKDG